MSAASLAPAKRGLNATTAFPSSSSTANALPDGTETFRISPYPNSFKISLGEKGELLPIYEHEVGSKALPREKLSNTIQQSKNPYECYAVSYISSRLNRETFKSNSIKTFSQYPAI